MGVWRPQQGLENLPTLPFEKLDKNGVGCAGTKEGGLTWTWDRETSFKSRRKVVRTFLCALLSGPIVGTNMVAGRALAVVDGNESSMERYVNQREGFEFRYPSNWVVAFDRSGGNKDGAVMSVGDFTKFMVVTVFRQVENIPEDVKRQGFTMESGDAVCIDPVAQNDITIGFLVERAELIPTDNNTSMFEFEYKHSICRGEKIEAAGGVLRCNVRLYPLIYLFSTLHVFLPLSLCMLYLSYILMDNKRCRCATQGNFGQDVPIQQKHIVGRALFNSKQKHIMTIMASVPVDTWNESSKEVIRGIVETFSPA